MNDRTHTHDVVIAGGGPTGLMLAAELALAGVSAVIVERRESQSLPGSRAGGLQARSLEMLDLRGVADRFIRQGKTLQINALGDAPLSLADFPTRHPYGLALFQEPIERTLAEWAAELKVPTLRGREVGTFEQDDAGVRATLSDGTVLRAKYLVGCDGGRSVVRKQAGIDFAGVDATTTYLIAEVMLTSAPPPGIRRTAKGVNGVGPLGAGPRMRAVLCEPEVRHGETPTLEELKAALTAVYGTDFGAHDVSWISRFSDAARQAASYRKGRVFVAGDAAHVHSPVGGQGLNTGIQDAMNLGWKLGQVIRGVSSDALLDTYHSERHPIGARVLEGTLAATALNRGDAPTNALRKVMAEVLAHDGPRKQWAGLLSGLDLRYDFGAGHPLLGRRMPDLDVTTAEGTKRVSSFMHAARPVLFDFGTPGGLANAMRVEAKDPWTLPVTGAVAAPTGVLVRPDGYVAWVGEGSDVGLTEALARWC